MSDPVVLAILKKEIPAKWLVEHAAGVIHIIAPEGSVSRRYHLASDAVAAYLRLKDSDRSRAEAAVCDFLRECAEVEFQRLRREALALDEQQEQLSWFLMEKPVPSTAAR